MKVILQKGDYVRVSPSRSAVSGLVSLPKWHNCIGRIVLIDKNEYVHVRFEHIPNRKRRGRKTWSFWAELLEPVTPVEMLGSLDATG